MRAQNRLLESFPSGYNFILVPNDSMGWPWELSKWEKVEDAPSKRGKVKKVSAEYGGIQANVYYSPNELAAELGSALVPVPYVDDAHTLFHYGVDNSEPNEIENFLESKGLTNFVTAPIELLDFSLLGVTDFCILSTREGKLVPKSITVEPEPK